MQNIKETGQAECPKCHSHNIARFVYGHIPLDTKANETFNQRLKNKEIVLSGCIIDLDSPKYHCNDCGNNFGTLNLSRFSFKR